jgi:hypothetical protein
VIAATLEANQTVLVGIATDEPVTAVELRRAGVGSANVHREAGAIELDTGRPAPAVEATLAIRAVDWVFAVLVAALDIAAAFPEAANLAVATIVVVSAFLAPALVAAVAAVTILVVTTLRTARSAATPPTFRTVVVAAAFGACGALRLLVVAAVEPVTAGAAQSAGGIDRVAPVAWHPAAAFRVGSAIRVVAAGLVLVTAVVAGSVIAVFAPAAML